MSIENIRQGLDEAFGPHVSPDDLIAQFPAEMHDDLDSETASMNDKEAVTFLKDKLARRHEKLVEFSPAMIPEGIEVSNEVPLAFIKSIGDAEAGGEDNYVGAGQNGKFLRSVREPSTGHKILFNEQAERTGANIVREVILQYKCERLLRDKNNVAKIPKIWRYVKTKDIQAIRMDLIEGESIGELMKRGGTFPESFDVERFFEKLLNAVVILNQSGYHHRDLTNNSGNVIVSSEGEPWIIDFGSAVEVSPDPDDSNKYQERPGASYVIGTDQRGVEGLKRKVLAYIRKQGDQTS